MFRQRRMAKQFQVHVKTDDGKVGLAPTGPRTVSKATINSRSMNVRAPMRILRTMWPLLKAGDQFEWIAYPAADIVVLKRKL